MREFLIAVTRNPLSLAGTAITTASALVFLGLFAVDLTSHYENPYMGIVAYMILPAIFVVGLILIPIGVAREKRIALAARQRGEPHRAFPIIDLNTVRTRKVALTFFLLTLANIVILAAATYRGVEYMESVKFCGQTCHTVMQPEHTAYSRSPHARVECVDCHIGPGANWFVRSKLSGAWQVVSVAFDLFPRPIPTPIENLRPARDTCEQCHWPAKFVGDRLDVRTRFQEDEPNTETKTVLVLRIGGVQGRTAQGIHWHVDPNQTIRYRSNAARDEIYDVELTQADGTVKLFRSGSAQPAEGTETAWRTMDCMDCHNRPTHIYRTPRVELDAALADGRIDRDLPYVRREGARLLNEPYTSHAEAKQKIAEGLRAFYTQSYPDLAASAGPRIDHAAEAIGNIYSWNVFPEMKVNWDTYPNHLGHNDAPGCFRCHDESHTTEGGETISQDCETCHTLLAMEEENPQVLETLKP